MTASLAAIAVGQAASTQAASTIAPKQEVVTLLNLKSVAAQPGARTLSVVSDQRPITLRRTTLPVLAEQKDAAGKTWLKVRLPGRVFHRRKPPRTGWISSSYTRRSTTPWHVVVNVRQRRVLAYREGRLMRSFRAIVGKPSTPTPRGDFFIEETLRMPAKYQGGPYALATSARSAVYKQFMGGPGQVALHGVKGIGGQMGTAASAGCIRLSSEAVTWLAQFVKQGTPLTIR